MTLSRSRWSVASLLLVLALALAACGNDPEPAGGGAEEPEPVATAADFEVQELVTVDPSDSPDGISKVEGEEPKVVSLLNDLYNAAFLDPDLWEDGAHPAMAELFTEKGQTRLVPERDLDALALAQSAPQLDRVVPERQEVTKLTFFVGDNLTTPLALASVVFVATGTPVDSDQQPVTIVHTANYWIAFDDGYKITSFEAMLGIDESEREQS